MQTNSFSISTMNIQDLEEIKDILEKDFDDFEKNSVPKTKKKKIYIVKNKDQMTQGD